MNIVPKATLICFSLALIMGETAAIALPPQMAVPIEIRKDISLLILRLFPTIYPNTRTIRIERTVSRIPSLLAFNAVPIFIPKPKPTTETCNNRCVAL